MEKLWRSMEGGSYGGRRLGWAERDGPLASWVEGAVLMVLAAIAG